MWSTPEYEEPLPSNSYNYPITKTSRNGRLDVPVRMRSLAINNTISGFTIASCAGATCGVLFHYAHLSEENAFYSRLDQSSQDIVWQFFSLNPTEYIADICVRHDATAPMGLQDPCLSIVLRGATGQARTIQTGWSIPDHYHDRYTFLSLVNDDKMKVSRFYINEPSSCDRLLRVAVQCEELDFSVPASLPRNSLPPHPPASSCPLGLPMRDLYWSSVDLTRYSSFRLCLARSGKHEHCIGIMFFPARDVLGQWRMDLAQSEAFALPTDMLLRNVDRDECRCVQVARNENEEGGVSLEGVLEWWCSSRESWVAGH